MSVTRSQTRVFRASSSAAQVPARCQRVRCAPVPAGPAVAVSPRGPEPSILVEVPAYLVCCRRDLACHLLLPSGLSELVGRARTRALCQNTLSVKCRSCPRGRTAEQPLPGTPAVFTLENRRPLACSFLAPWAAITRDDSQLNWPF